MPDQTPPTAPCGNVLVSLGSTLMCTLPHGHPGGHTDGGAIWAYASEAPRVVDVDSLAIEGLTEERRRDFLDSPDVRPAVDEEMYAKIAATIDPIDPYDSARHPTFRAVVDAARDHEFHRTLPELSRLSALELDTYSDRVETLTAERDAARAERDQIAQDFDDLKRQYEEIVPPTARVAGKNRPKDEDRG